MEVLTDTAFDVVKPVFWTQNPLTQSSDGAQGSWSGDGQSLRLMVSGGFAEVDNQHVTVLTEHAALPEEVNAPELRKILEELEEQIRVSGSHSGHHMLTAEIERVSVKLDIAR